MQVRGYCGSNEDGRIGSGEYPREEAEDEAAAAEARRFFAQRTNVHFHVWTTREIIAWAGTRGVHIEPLPRTNKSLSAAWQELAANASNGKLTKVEITAALERSIRRRSARIPVAFQIILLKILSSTYE